MCTTLGLRNSASPLPAVWPGTWSLPWSKSTYTSIRPVPTSNSTRTIHYLLLLDSKSFKIDWNSVCITLVWKNPCWAAWFQWQQPILTKACCWSTCALYSTLRWQLSGYRVHVHIWVFFLGQCPWCAQRSWFSVKESHCQTVSVFF